MDITASSRDYFAMPSPSPSEKLSLAASSTVYTYHCLCTHLLLATSTPLHALPTRQNSLDTAHIMPLPPPPPSAPTSKPRRPSREPALPPSDHYGLLISTRLEQRAEVVTSADGFEKRYLQRCGRCNLVVGYQLDWQAFAEGEKVGRREDVVYLLPDGFVTTSEMIMGKTPDEQGGIGMLAVAQIKI